jgi:hypothetical protein
MRNLHYKKNTICHSKLKIRTPCGIRIYDVAGISCLDLRQIITLLQEPQLQVQPQQPSSSYDE